MKKQKKNTRHELKKFTPEELIEAYKKQIENKTWTFFDERKHIEDLLCQRFNYLILAFSLFTTAFATIDGDTNKIIILIVGFIVLSLLGGTVRRAYLKLDIYLKMIHRLDGAVDSDDPAERKTGYNALSMVDKEVLERRFQLGHMNQFIGVWIPLLLVVCFAVGIVAMALGWWSSEVCP